VIRLSNGHQIEYLVASGALGFDCKGWPWEWPLVWLGLIRPELFAVVIKTLTLNPRKGNLRWWKPWGCVRPIPGGGTVNKVGLTNMGGNKWCDEIAPTVDFRRPTMASIFGTREELIRLAEMLNPFGFMALKVNPSCPNSGHKMQDAEAVIGDVKAVKKASRLPVIVKVSVAQDYLAIANGLAGIAEAIALNSVPWEIVFPGRRSPLWRLEKRVGGGGGGVSGRPAQKFNWEAVEQLAKQGALPVIAPSIKEFGDLARVRSLGAQAVSFGEIHLPDYPVWLKPWTLFTNPCKPTRYVRKEIQHGKN